MVAFSDIERIEALRQQVQNIDAAFANFDAGGVIVLMAVSAGAEPPAGTASPSDRVVVETTDMPYPEQMVQAIRGFLGDRRAAALDELAQLGVTDAHEPGPR